VASGEGKLIMDHTRIVELDLERKMNLYHSFKDEFASDMNFTYDAFIIGLLFIFVAFVIVGFFLIRSITIPISELLAGACKIGEGDLNVSIPTHNHHELGELGESFNDMVKRLSNLRVSEKKISDLLERVAFTSVAIGSEAINQSQDTKKILQIITDHSRSLIGADFAALGIGTDSHVIFDPWVFSGMDETDVKKIGHFPRAIGLLGWVSRQGQAVRIDDLNSSPVFQGFPKNHPAMGPLLGIPIRFKGASVGNLYLSRKPGRETFTEHDQRAIELLTAQAGVAIENSRLQTELQKAVSGREDVLAIVSHDLKNPLASIKMSAQLMHRKALEGPPGDNVRKFTNNIQVSCGQMLRMISDLLDAAAIEAGKIHVTLALHEAHAYFIQLENQFKPLADAKGIKLEIPLPKEGVYLCCDLDRIQQVFSNLLGNALKFTPVNGTIRIDHRMEKKDFIVNVSDTGPGISPQDQEHLFNRYWQVRGTKQRGTGLGLFIAKGIMEAHDALLLVQSTLGKGTSFSFVVPFQEH
jgi:signal transduction histidine kinase/HAMP domain-containing protein